jgi:hypothetical protein
MLYTVKFKNGNEFRIETNDEAVETDSAWIFYKDGQRYLFVPKENVLWIKTT